MHTLILTPEFISQARRCGVSEQELYEIQLTISDNPLIGDVMKGTGGARKLRHAGRGRGKSGGYRTIHYYAAEDVPVFLLAIYGKGTKDNLTKAERTELSKILPLLADVYRNATRK